MTEDEILERAQKLAEAAVEAGAKENHLNWALTHLKRHRNVAETDRLMRDLRFTAFARRAQRTREQLEALHTALHHALATVRNDRDAAQIVGWARRLMPVLRLDRKGP
jgi:hypothetical protein